MPQNRPLIKLTAPGNEHILVDPMSVAGIRKCGDRNGKSEIAIAGMWVRVIGTIADVCKQLGIEQPIEPAIENKELKPQPGIAKPKDEPKKPSVVGGVSVVRGAMPSSSDDF